MEEFNELVGILMKSNTEVDIIKNLKYLIKNKTSEFCSSEVLKNPYFKSLIPEIKDEIIYEIEDIKSEIDSEVDMIELEIENLNKKNIDKSYDKFILDLESLKRDCISLIYEIEDRKREINSL